MRDIEPIIRRISLNRFKVGGAAMFAARKRNHHIDKIGAFIKIPLDKAMLRVAVLS